VFSVTKEVPSEPHWHPHPGDAFEDTFELPGLLLCGLSVVALALTLTAGAAGHLGWVAGGAVATALLFLCGMVLVRLEYVREWKAERRRGRHGHNPLVAGKWHGSAT
jgi:hypothetical protein